MTTRAAALALAALLAGFSAPADAQTVRFQTSVGAFDMLLNPTNNSRSAAARRQHARECRRGGLPRDRAEPGRR